MPKKVEPSEIIVIQDTREQCPLDLAAHGLTVEIGPLKFGDYTIKYPDLIDDFVIERKTLPDFVACCGRDRDRFERELHTLRGYKWAFLLCEFGLRDVFNHEYRSKICPNAVLSSIAKWAGYGVHFLPCDHADGASYIAAKLVYFVASDVITLARCKINLPEIQARLCVC